MVIEVNINCFINIPEFVFNYFVNKNNLNYESIKNLNEEKNNEIEVDDYMIYNENELYFNHN